MKPLIVLLGLVGVGGFSWASWNFLHEDIAQSLTSQAQEVLNEKGLNATVSFDHLDGVVRGVESEAEQAEIREAIESVLPAGRITFADATNDADLNDISIVVEENQPGVTDALTEPGQTEPGQTESSTISAQSPTAIAAAAGALSTTLAGQSDGNRFTDANSANEAADAVVSDANVSNTVVSDTNTLSTPAIVNDENPLASNVAQSEITTDSVEVQGGPDERNTSPPFVAEDSATSTPSRYDTAAAPQSATNAADDKGFEAPSGDAFLEAPLKEVDPSAIADTNSFVEAGTDLSNGESLQPASSDLTTTQPDATSLSSNPINSSGTDELTSNALANGADLPQASNSTLTLDQPDNGTLTDIAPTSNAAAGTSAAPDTMISETGIGQVDRISLPPAIDSSDAFSAGSGSAANVEGIANSTDAAKSPAAESLTSPTAPKSTNDLVIPSTSSVPPTSPATAALNGGNSQKRVPPRLGIFMSPKQSNSIIRKVEVASAAYEAGVRNGDRVISFGGRQVGKFADLVSAVRRFWAGDEVEIIIERDGQRLTRKVTLKAAPAKPPKANTPPKQQ